MISCCTSHRDLVSLEAHATLAQVVLVGDILLVGDDEGEDDGADDGDTADNQHGHENILNNAHLTSLSVTDFSCDFIITHYTLKYLRVLQLFSQHQQLSPELRAGAVHQILTLHDRNI